MTARLSAGFIAALMAVAGAHPSQASDNAEDTIAQVLQMGAAFHLCPTGTISSRAMAMGAMVIARETGLEQELALSALIENGAKLAETVAKGDIAPMCAQMKQTFAQFAD